MNKIKISILVLFIIHTFLSYAQESIRPSLYNPNIKTYPVHSNQTTFKEKLKSSISTYPFFDDFSESNNLNPNLWSKGYVDIRDSSGDQPNKDYAVLDNKKGNYYYNSTIIGDTLTSQNINLSGMHQGDNVYLSYYFKYSPYSDTSSNTSTFAVEFYSSVNNSWKTIRTFTNALIFTKYAFDTISIKDSIYLNSNFKIRFRVQNQLKSNSLLFADSTYKQDTINQSWNLDYIYLNKRNGIPKQDTSSGGICQHPYLSLPFFDDFSDSIGYVKKRFWTDNDVYINSSYADTAPTIGVATFDALNNQGYLYPQALTNTVFSADKFTSVRLPMSLYSNDSVYLSFYYEPGGLGEIPDKTDSLILEFFNPSSLTWDWVWSVPGDSVRKFKLAMIPIKQKKYLDFGFQFRFRNLASINIQNADLGRNGNGDIWNLDYVKLDMNRHWNDTIFHDLAFMSPLKCPLLNFTSVPQSHFRLQNAYSVEMDKSVLSFAIHNNDNISRGVQVSCMIKDFYNSSSYPGGDPSALQARADTIVLFNNYPLIENPILSTNTDSAYFKITLSLDSTLQNEPHTNDTLVYYQLFRNFYSYDDGSAEWGYGIGGINSKNAQIALRYKTYMADSLQAVDIYFNPTLNKLSPDGSTIDTTFKLMVWALNGSKPGTVLYASKDTSYSPYIGFHRYFLVPPIAVPQNYFVGTKQNDNYFLNIGFDASRNNSDKLYYNTDNIDSAYSWIPSSIKGTLMIRPIVGNWKDALSTVKSNSLNSQDIQIFPNPTSGILNIVIPENKMNNKIMLFDLTGKMLKNEEISTSTININELHPGIYLLRVVTGNGNIYNAKVVKYTY
jgi:hypothetical protein